MDPFIARSKNQLLAMLPDAEWQRWRPSLELVELPMGKVLHEPGERLSHVYFPLAAVVSICHFTAAGDMTKVALVGHEGMVDIASLMGEGCTNTHAVLVHGGHALRMRSSLIKHEFEHAGPVQSLMLRYIQAMIAQIGQTAVCNRHHSIDQALTLWLLLCLDRIPGNDLVMTQELIANMLGVRREGITDAALKLQRAGLIRYSRGHITVIDRKGLEHLSCECYRAVKNEHDRLLRLEQAIDFIA